MSIIRRGLGGAASTLGLPGLGTVASEQMQSQVLDRKKQKPPSAFGDLAVSASATLLS